MLAISKMVPLGREDRIHIHSGMRNGKSGLVKMVFKIVRDYKMLISLLVIFLISGCQEKEECPAYPTEYLKWMPYKMGQTLTFIDGNKVFPQKVEQFEVSKKHKVSKDFYGYHCTPYAQAEISSSAAYPKINLWSSWGCSGCGTTINMSSLIHFMFTIYDKDDEGSNFGFAFENESLFMDSEYYGTHYKGEMLNKHQNGYKEYSRVICLEYDTLIQAPDIYKLYIAESVGIIEYVRKKGNQSVYLTGD